jgi:predicted DsbA family dithiol-disulfide isomerase
MAGLLRAHHTDGRNIADPAVLRDVGLAAGLDGDDLDAVLAGGTGAYADAVRRDERRAAERGIRGVPAFAVAGGPPVPGLPVTEDLRDRIDRALAAAPAERTA